MAELVGLTIEAVFFENNYKAILISIGDREELDGVFT